MISLHALAKQWGGEVCGSDILIPGPGHGPNDRSLSVRLSGKDFVVHSFADDPLKDCRDYVNALLGGQAVKFDVKQSDAPRPDKRPRALAIWAESQPWQGSLVETYLKGRGVALPPDCVDVRFNPACPMGREIVPAMVALIRSVSTREPLAIHRTHLNLDGTKGRLDRMALAPMADGVVMLTPYNRVWMDLGIGEGIETALSLRACPDFGNKPIWAALSATQLGKFFLPNIDHLVIAADHDPAGVRGALTCGTRAASHGTEVTLIAPTASKTDLNDLLKGAAS